MPRNVLRPRPEEVPSLFIGGIGQQVQKDSAAVITQLTTLCEEIAGPGSVRKVTLKNGYSFIDFTGDEMAVKVAEKVHRTQFMKRWIVAQVQTVENHRVRQQERRKERAQVKRSSQPGTSNSNGSVSGEMNTESNSGTSGSGGIPLSETSGESSTTAEVRDLPVATPVACALPVALMLENELVEGSGVTAVQAPVVPNVMQQGFGFPQGFSPAVYGAQGPVVMSVAPQQQYFLPTMMHQMAAQQQIAQQQQQIAQQQQQIMQQQIAQQQMAPFMQQQLSMMQPQLSMMPTFR